jgi:hypothetical protein
MALNASYASPTADAQYALRQVEFSGILSRLTQGWSAWSIALTLFMGLVLYDQCTCVPQ